MFGGVHLHDLDEVAVRAQVERALSAEPYWFPVRHHSPAVARHVADAVRARRPRVVFIEGPAEATPLLRHLADARTRPPVALYSSYREGETRTAVWYPLLAYSPEYVAATAAFETGAEAELVDLPHFALPARRTSGARPDPERALVESRFYEALAESAGFRSWDQAWDSLFEFSPQAADREGFRRQLALFCAAARATSDPERLRVDGTRERERHMWRAIQAGLERRGLQPAEAMVVTGGFHMFLDRDDPTPPPALPAGAVQTSVVPYSFFRVSELSGYGAGNRAPQFYQAAWELGPGQDEERLARHVVATLAQARREGEAVSAADAVSVAQHARMLAALRRRPVPILDDLHDAVMACCCKGRPEEEGRGLRRAMDAVDIGARIGSVTPELGRLPLVQDFHAQLAALGLAAALEQEKRLTLRLDKRQALDRRRSALLHRLRYLRIPFAEWTDSGGDASGTLFREVWRLLWSPAVEPALTERNLYGDTLEAAAAALLREELAAHPEDAALTCRRLREAVEMELPGLVEEAEEACAPALARDPRFVGLAQALHELQLLQRQLLYRQERGAARLDALASECFTRACLALSDAMDAPEPEQEAVVEGLRLLGESRLGDSEGRYDRALLAESVRAAAEASSVPFLRGAFLGLLAELRAVPPEVASEALAAFAREPAERLVQAGEFLDGLLAASRTSLLLGAEHLVDAIDALLRAAGPDAFLAMLPRLRGAFERVHESLRLTLADRVARRYGLREGGELARLEVSLATAALVARLDEQAEAVLREWGL